MIAAGAVVVPGFGRPSRRYGPVPPRFRRDPPPVANAQAPDVAVAVGRVPRGAVGRLQLEPLLRAVRAVEP